MNLVRAFDLQNYHFDEDVPWSFILAAANFVFSRAHHTTLQIRPYKLVLGGDMTKNIPL